mmetsp:Transcript_12123/g.20117  ORF Transcript_12123/g.20117 Transcript_12123/m.20117 type:complete len:353 (+) Transcript_12123:408-1466(+)
MMQQQSPCEDNFSTPANLRPTFNNAAMFDDFISPPLMMSLNSSCAAEEQQLVQRRSFVLHMDQQLRRQREEVEQQQAEHSDHAISSLAAAAGNRTTILLGDEEELTARRIPRLRPYFRPPTTPARSCSACAKLSMKTPPHNSRPLQQCQQCGTTSAASIMDLAQHQATITTTTTPISASRETLRPMPPIVVDAQFLSSGCATEPSSPLARFVLQGPGDDHCAGDYTTELLDLSLLDSEMVDIGEPRRISLRPKMKQHSRTSSPMLSVASSSCSIMEETDFVTTNDNKTPIIVATPPVVVMAAACSTYPAAPLLPLMSPETARPRTGINQPFQIRLPPITSYSTPGGLTAPRY